MYHLAGIALLWPVLVHLCQNGVIRRYTFGETSTIPLVGIPNLCTHKCESIPPKAEINVQLKTAFWQLFLAPASLGSSVAADKLAAASLAAAAAMAAAAGTESTETADAAAACTYTTATGQLR